MATVDQATEAQDGFIKRLFAERDTDRLTEEQRDWLERNVGNLSLVSINRGQASRVIAVLKALPKVTRQQEARAQGGPHGVPNGRYAIDTGDNILRFFKVNSPTDGKWVGCTFVDQQFSDELEPVRNRVRRELILKIIARDIQGNMLRYGQEIGSCGHCGRTLTNELSRELGIGPICRGKMGW